MLLVQYTRACLACGAHTRYGKGLVMKGYSVLVVERDWAVGSMLTDLLELDGYQVVVARTGQAAIQQVHTSPPQVVLLDDHLSDMTMAECVSVLRALHPHLPIVRMTTNNQSDQRGPRVDMLRTLRKPFDTAALLSLLEGATSISGSIPG